MSKKKCLSRSRRPLKWAWPQANKHSSESWQSWTSHSIFELTRVKKAWMMFPSPELDHWMWCVTSFWRFRCVISTTPLSDQSRESKDFATKFLMLLFSQKKSLLDKRNWEGSSWCPLMDHSQHWKERPSDQKTSFRVAIFRGSYRST